jgi:hypothetical protein
VASLAFLQLVRERLIDPPIVPPILNDRYEDYLLPEFQLMVQAAKKELGNLAIW